MPVYRDESHRFINPYTFIPPRSEGPLVSQTGGDVSHALIDEKPFTGRIECELEFITPAVIPGKREPEKTPGEIYAYTILDNGVERLAIPGSRLRGHVLHIMRLLNGSPILSSNFDDRKILKRRIGNIRKGFILSDWKIQEINNEILVAANDRSVNVDLRGNATLLREHAVIIDQNGQEITLSKSTDSFNINLGLDEQGKEGAAYWARPSWQPMGTQAYKQYHAKCDLNSKDVYREDGRWVVFDCWSGQDRYNDLIDLHAKKSRVHRNALHLVDLSKKNLGKCRKLPHAVLQNFNQCVQELVRLAGDNSSDLDILKRIADMTEFLKPGTFVYFTVNESDTINSIGLHYHYLVPVGSIGAAIGALKQKNSDCLVDRLAGRGAGDTSGGWRSRIWVDMAIGPKKCAKGELALKPGQPGDLDEATCQQVPLRILSSPPPKAARFYLERPDWTSAAVRGRKIYWHDPKWKTENIDVPWDAPKAKYSFENPVSNTSRFSEHWPPNKSETEKELERIEDLINAQNSQWCKAEVLPRGCKYKFSIRLLNANDDEFYLLLSAIIGLKFALRKNPDSLSSESETEQNPSWCHKIGYARPFMGSAVIRILNIQRLVFDTTSCCPKFEKEDLTCVSQKLTAWQIEHRLKAGNAGNPLEQLNAGANRENAGATSNKEPHVAMLERAMSFHGAFLGEEIEDHNVRISYPLAQKTNNENEKRLKWGRNLSRWPTIYNWFGIADEAEKSGANGIEKSVLRLPEPKPEKSQALPSLISYKPPNNPGGGGGPQHRGRPRNQGGNRR